MHTAWKLNKGFSLVEIMGVIVLVIILAALAAPSFDRAMDWYRVQSSANMIAGEMEAARVLAVSRGASYRLNFDSGNNTVTVIDIDDPDNPPRVPKRLERGVSFSQPGKDIIFYPRGHASVAETVRVSNKKGDALQVAVLISGKVTVGACTSQQQTGGTVIPSDGGADSSSSSSTEIQ